MTLRELYNLTATIVLIVTFIWAAMFVAGAFEPKPEPLNIPTPPPGQEYCVTDNGTAMGFCPKGR